MQRSQFTRRTLIKTAAGVAVSALAVPYLGKNAFAAETIKLGSLMDGTGPLALEGHKMIQATEYAVEVLNKQGGLLGKKVDLIAFDTQSNNQLYTQYAQKLALEEKVDVVHGALTSASREAIRPIFGRSKTLYFYNTHYEGGVCDRNTFCIGTTPTQTVNHLVDYALKNVGKKIYVIAADYNYGHILSAWIKEFTAAGGGEIVAVDFFPLDVTNFSSAISRIQAAEPAVVLTAIVGANHAGFYRQWDAAGMKAKIPVVSAVFGLGDELNSVETSTTDGIVTCYGWYNSIENALTTEFMSGMKAKFGGDMNDLGELDSATYEGIMLWAEAVKQANSVERDKVIEALESGISYEGPSGVVTIDPVTHHTKRNAYLAVPKNKKWEILDTFVDQVSADTKGACDLMKAPRTNKQFTPQI